MIVLNFSSMKKNPIALKKRAQLGLCLLPPARLWVTATIDWLCSTFHISSGEEKKPLIALINMEDSGEIVGPFK